MISDTLHYYLEIYLKKMMEKMKEKKYQLYISLRYHIQKYTSLSSHSAQYRI